MMKNILSIVLCGIILAGCGSVQTKTVYKDKYIPIPYVPEPPVVEPPEYYSSTLTDEQKEDIGELSKAFVIDSTQLKDYADKLEKVYEMMVSLAESSANRIKAIESMGGEVDHSLMEQSNAEVNTELKSLSNTIATQTEETEQNISELRQMKKPE